MISQDDFEKIRNRDAAQEITRWLGRMAGYKYDPNTYRWEKKYNLSFSVPVPLAELEAAWAAGMLRKEELIGGEYYWGACRNASVARWSATRGLFEHMRYKSGWRVQEIPYPGDEETYEIAPGRMVGHDIFVPWVRVEPLPFELVCE